VKWFSAFITCGGRKMDGFKKEGRKKEEWKNSKPI
jgi:hypothetical protein